MKRDPNTIITQILSMCTTTTRVTKLIQSVHLNFYQLNRYIKYLNDRNLIIEEKKEECFGISKLSYRKHKIRQLTITERGIKFLDLLTIIHKPEIIGVTRN